MAILWKISLLPSIVVLCACDIMAQSDAIETDRPDQTEASSVVGKGVFQCELGFQFTRTSEATGGTEHLQRSNQVPGILLRYGISRKFELRLVGGFESEVHPDAQVRQREEGFSPLAVGFKYYLTPEQGLLPEISFIGHLTLPWIGEDVFRPERLTPDFRFSLSHTLGNRFSLGTNLGMHWDESIPHFIYTVALSADVVGPIGAFVEFYGEIPESEKWRHSLHGGVTLLVLPDLQFDASYSYLLGIEHVNEHYLSFGASFRLGARRALSRSNPLQ